MTALEREALGNPAILVEEAATRDTFEVAGRGELQISVLVETLRREGFEFGVSRPEIILREVEGRSCEPVEEVWIDVPEKVAGSVMEKLGGRRGRMVSMEHEGELFRLRLLWADSINVWAGNDSILCDHYRIDTDSTENKIKILDQTDYFSENITQSNLIKQLWVEKSGEKKIIQASAQMSGLAMKAIISLE